MHLVPSALLLISILATTDAFFLKPLRFKAGILVGMTKEFLNPGSVTATEAPPIEFEDYDFDFSSLGTGTETDSTVPASEGFNGSTDVVVTPDEKLSSADPSDAFDASFDEVNVSAYSDETSLDQSSDYNTKSGPKLTTISSDGLISDDPGFSTQDFDLILSDSLPSIQENVDNYNAATTWADLTTDEINYLSDQGEVSPNPITLDQNTFEPIDNIAPVSALGDTDVTEVNFEGSTLETESPSFGEDSAFLSISDLNDEFSNPLMESKQPESNFDTQELVFSENSAFLSIPDLNNQFSNPLMESKQPESNSDVQQLVFKEDSAFISIPDLNDKFSNPLMESKQPVSNSDTQELVFSEDALVDVPESNNGISDPITNSIAESNSFSLTDRSGVFESDISLSLPPSASNFETKPIADDGFDGFETNFITNENAVISKRLVSSNTPRQKVPTTVKEYHIPTAEIQSQIDAERKDILRRTLLLRQKENQSSQQLAFRIKDFSRDDRVTRAKPLMVLRNFSPPRAPTVRAKPPRKTLAPTRRQTATTGSVVRDTHVAHYPFHRTVSRPYTVRFPLVSAGNVPIRAMANDQRVVAAKMLAHSRAHHL